MKPVEVERVLIESPRLSQGMFGLSANAKDQAHILNILRNRLYTNKILAVLREYSTNAIDAHTSVGLVKPIRVQLPTALDPHLLIRDYGPGLDEEDIYGIYTQYGASTKRETNTQIGMLGIGAKSAFSYSDSFVVTSYCKNKKSVYVAALDETNVGKLSKQWEGPTEETGIEVRIPVRPSDIGQFKQEAFKLFKFYDPLPNTNYAIPAISLPSIVTEFGYCLLREEFRRTHEVSHWIGKVGVVPYNLTLGAGVLLTPEHEKIAEEFLGCLYFDIGEVDIAANREELEYTQKTNKAIRAKLAALVNSVVQNIIRSVEAQPAGVRRLQCLAQYHKEGMLSQFLIGKTQTDIYKSMIFDAKHIHVFSHPLGHPDRVKTTRFTVSRKVLDKKWVECDQFTWTNQSFLIEDIKILPRLRSRYTKLHQYYLVKPDPGITPDYVEAQLKERLDNQNLQGVPILRASQVDLGYVPPVPRKYVRKPKEVTSGLTYWVDEFTWADLHRPMLPSDVVLLFENTRTVHTAQKLIHSINPFFEMPTFVKPKKSYKGPIIGIQLEDWIGNTIAANEGIDWYARTLLQEKSTILCSPAQQNKFSKTLGDDHFLVKLIKPERPELFAPGLRLLSDWVMFEKTYIDHVHDRYPLLGNLISFNGSLRGLTENSEAVIRYIQLIDMYGA